MANLEEPPEKAKSKKVFLNALDSFQGKNIGKVCKKGSARNIMSTFCLNRFMKVEYFLLAFTWFRSMFCFFFGHWPFSSLRTAVDRLLKTKQETEAFFFLFFFPWFRPQTSIFIVWINCAVCWRPWFALQNVFSSITHHGQLRVPTSW